MINLSDLQQHYRLVADQMTDAGVELDPQASYILDALADVVRVVVADAVYKRKLRGILKSKVYGFKDIPNKINIEAGELVIVHYPRMYQPTDTKTSDWYGSVEGALLTVSVMAMSNWPQADMGVIAIKTADIPDLLMRTYKANSRLWRPDGQSMLIEEMVLNPMSVGNLPFAGDPIGWQGDLIVPISHNMKGWLFG